RLRLLEMYALSLLIALPAALLVLASPVVEDTSTSALVLNLLGTSLLRAVLVAGPFAVLALMRSPLARRPALLFLALLVANGVLVPLRHNEFAWGALLRRPDHSLEAFTASSVFTPGRTYRILRVA